MSKYKFGDKVVYDGVHGVIVLAADGAGHVAIQCEGELRPELVHEECPDLTLGWEVPEGMVLVRAAVAVGDNGETSVHGTGRWTRNALRDIVKSDVLMSGADEVLISFIEALVPGPKTKTFYAEVVKMMTPRCRSCWWQEGGRCYSEKVHGAPLPRDKTGRTPMLTTEQQTRCINVSARREKRQVLEQVIPGDMLVIQSERK